MLELQEAIISSEYRKKWNIGNQDDYKVLVKDGKVLRYTLYRLGGLSTIENLKNDYFLLLKYIEDYYDNIITKNPKEKPHLASHWVIIDKEGNEKVEFEQFQHPFLVKNSVIYSIDSKYYNIETGYYYGKASGQSMESKDYIFIWNRFAGLFNSDKHDETMRGVIRINKKTGTWKLYKGE
jgi:hypothetical protein